MIARILSWLFPPTLRVLPEDLHVILNYHERLHRGRPPLVESEAGPAIPMMFYHSEPGRYIGLGREVIADLIAQGYVNTIHDCWEKEEK